MTPGQGHLVQETVVPRAPFSGSLEVIFENQCTRAHYLVTKPMSLLRKYCHHKMVQRYIKIKARVTDGRQD
jgi:hypothetical protein